jgi:hypothetical protein
VERTMNRSPSTRSPDNLLDRWLNVYERAYSGPAALTGLSCPNCGSSDLHLVFVSFVCCAPLRMSTKWRCAVVEGADRG